MKARNDNKARCRQKCDDMEEEDIIDLYYETGGFSVYPEDEDFDFYLNY